MKIGIVSLGCDKNVVDAEYLAGALDRRGHTVVAEGPHGALDVLVIYTCGFIESARAQSIDTLEAYVEAKRRLGNPRRIVLVGCLTQRYGEELRPHLPDVDVIAGVGRPEAIADLVESVGRNDGAARRPAAQPRLLLPPPLMRIERPLPRKRLDRAPAVYLKIADGCDHACSFCAIPAMKGPYASVPREILIDEARQLLATGARELNLIAQDLSPYGRDLYPNYALPELLHDLCRIEGDFWVRLLYLYPAALTRHPAALTRRFIDVFAREPKICKYLDLPLQHLDPRILRAMRRPAGDENAADRIRRLRRRVPDVVIRTTMMVGFPGETREAFENLLRGVREIRFERLGAFVFSPEERTPAAAMPGRVSPATARRRLDRLMRAQAEVSAELQRAQIGRTLRVLIESVDPDRGEARGRSYREAPEIDGQVIVRLRPRATRKKGPAVSVGDFVDLRVAEAHTHDLHAEPL